MTDNPPTVPNTPLQLVTVRGSSFAHYVSEGAYLTLCGRIAQHRPYLAIRKTYCRRCTIEASLRGWTTRP